MKTLVRLIVCLGWKFSGLRKRWFNFAFRYLPVSVFPEGLPVILFNNLSISESIWGRSSIGKPEYARRRLDISSFISGETP